MREFITARSQYRQSVELKAGIRKEQKSDIRIQKKNLYDILVDTAVKYLHNVSKRVVSLFPPQNTQIKIFQS